MPYLDALESAIDQDRKRGICPMCLIGIFGTTNTGAVEPIRNLRTIADREGMWLHADAAYGGMLLSSESSMRGRGLALADSVHHRPSQVVLRSARCRRHPRKGRATPHRVLRPESPPTSPMNWIRLENGINTMCMASSSPRRFRSLKVWMSFKRYGSRQIGD